MSLVTPTLTVYCILVPATSLLSIVHAQLHMAQALFSHGHPVPPLHLMGLREMDCGNTWHIWLLIYSSYYSYLS